MFLLLRLLPVLVVVAMLAAPFGTSAQVAGSSCLKIAQAEMCIDPALRANADGKTEVGGKKCFDATLGCAAFAAPSARSGHFAAYAAAPIPGASLTSPWRPPRLSA